MATVDQQGGWYLTSKEMLAIRKREYQYNAWSNSVLDPYMQPLWRFLVKKVPNCVAPSTLSVCGLACNVVAVCVTVYHAPTLTEDLPGRICFVNAISIFLYQTFDGLDGKQAQITQDSEVEEYADHAVDSLSITLNAILLAAAMQLGDSPVHLGLNLAMALSAFFTAHWAAHQTRSLVFGRVDVTEAQWSMIAIHLTSASRGQSVWRVAVGHRFSLGDGVCVSSIAALLYGTFSSVAISLGLKSTPLESSGIQIPRAAISLQPLLTWAVISGGLFLCAKSGLLSSATVPVMLLVGLATSKAAMRLTMAKLALRTPSTFEMGAFAPATARALHWLCEDRSTFVYKSTWAIVAISAADVLRFHICTLQDLARARGLCVFSVQKCTDENRQASTGFYVAGDNVKSVQHAWHEFAANEERLRSTYPT